MSSPVQKSPGRILLLDDDRALREMAGEFLRSLGHEVDEVGTLDQALARVRARPYDLVLSDLVLESGTGFDLLRAIKTEGLPGEVIIMTGHGGIEAAVEAIRQGAYNFITKPLTLARLELDVDKALEKRRLEEHVRRLSLSGASSFGGLNGTSPLIRQVYTLLERGASSDCNVLILGESGTGKEIAARAIHDHSLRAAGPFVTVHCGAIPPELLESELFGHRRGAFTGAERDRKGVFQAAAGGTLFLDEIGTAPARAQVGLLRALQERRIRPVGGDQDVDLNVRVISATNADLDEGMARGSFRQDLYYRLATLVVRMPPLRERREDITLLVSAILERLGARTGRRVMVSPRALERLSGRDWPGNVRELEHLLEQSFINARGPVVRAQDLPLPPAEAPGRVQNLEEVERAHIQRVLEICGGNKLRAARLLGIPRASLYRKIERFGLEEIKPANEKGQPPAPPKGSILPAYLN